MPSNNVFIQELNGILSKAYFIEGKTLSIYVFPSADDREKGMKAFEELTATMKVVSHKTYIANNVLVFYEEGDEETNKKLSAAINRLD